ncbi:MAG: T9SS type A sorting domain-containing protein [Lewinellaceae bacterium]|nr:T9SS type A sorting domain-containing protein [Lewinellaceae bacterium]
MAAVTPTDLLQTSSLETPPPGTVPAKIYPVPAADNLVVELPEAIPVGQLEIRDKYGRLVDVQALRGSRTEISLSGLTDGAYVVTLICPDQPAHSRKITKVSRK